ncbi:MAG TPA: hypothetical protein VGD77_13630 [Gemmatimonadaceae bacterium]
MMPMSQVGHVFRKDLREHRVRLALFVALVLVALARATGAPVPADQNVLAILVLFAGIAIVAAPLESDPPAGTRSFWVARPVAPGAMLAAKLAFAALLVLLAGVAQAIALWSLDLRTPEAIVYVARPVQLFALLLLATLVVAGASDDARARLLLVFALVIGLVFAVTKLSRVDPAPPWVKGASTAAAATLALGALSYFYRARRRGLIPVVMGFLVLALGGLAMIGRTAPVAPPLVGPDVPRPEVRLTVPPGAPAVYRRHLRLRLSASQPAPGWQYSMREPQLVVTLGSGRVIRIEADQNFMNFGGDPGPAPVPSAIAALRERAEQAGWQEVSVPLRRDLRVADGDTIQEVKLSGTVLVTRLRVVDTIPLAQGASRARRGVRTIIDSVAMPDGELEVVLRTEGLTKPDDQSRLFPFTSYFGRGYILLGPNGERMPMRQTWTGSSSVGLVLPTSAFGDAQLRLVPIDTGTASAREAGDTGWFRDARLLAVEPKVQGRYPIALEWKRAG